MVIGLYTRRGRLGGSWRRRWGYVAAIRAAELGMNVALVEKEN